MDDLKTKPCVCGKTMDQIIRIQEGPHEVTSIRVGWYCAWGCKSFDKAIGREKIYKKHEK